MSCCRAHQRGGTKGTLGLPVTAGFRVSLRLIEKNSSTAISKMAVA
ncbi:hypothetical protein QRQ56_07270 [Bradyrhizobium sp. U531]